MPNGMHRKWRSMSTEELGDLGLTDEQEDAIVAFLRTLSDGYVPEDKDQD